jgi:hypothetical protein
MSGALSYFARRSLAQGLCRGDPLLAGSGHAQWSNGTTRRLPPSALLSLGSGENGSLFEDSCLAFGESKDCHREDTSSVM